jgi:hypothetical protein
VARIKVFEHIAPYARNVAVARDVRAHRRHATRDAMARNDRSIFVSRDARHEEVDALNVRIIVAAWRVARTFVGTNRALEASRRRCVTCRPRERVETIRLQVCSSRTARRGRVSIAVRDAM